MSGHSGSDTDSLLDIAQTLKPRCPPLESVLLCLCCPKFYRDNRSFNCRAYLGARSFLRAFASI